MQQNRQRMLRITQSRSASGAKKYYCEEQNKERHSEALDYYSEHEMAIGTWGGKAATLLELHGGVTKQQFGALCDNINPNTGKQLTGRNDKNRTVGYDFTFDAGKSTSLIFALGSDKQKRQVLDAFQRSVSETMQDIEQDMQTRVRVKGKNENRLTGNIVYGTFTHHTTRPVAGITDCQLHQHVFVLNGTYDAVEKKWKAGDFKQIKQDAPYYEALFHARFALYLQEAGFEIERTKNNFEIKGFSQDTLLKFSRRTQEIEAYIRAHQITDEIQKSQVGARTRAAKKAQLSGEEQLKEWRSRLTAEEFQAIDAAGKSTPQQNHSVLAAQRAVQFALNHNMERKSVASDKEILATAIKSAIGEIRPEDAIQALNENEQVLSTTEKLRIFLTTKDALAEEQQLIRLCNESRNIFRPIHEGYMIQNKVLNAQQQTAVKHALNSTDGIILITGKAGTGKTTLMREVQNAIQDSGKHIFAFAPSSEASRIVQRSEGFTDADTVAALLQNKEFHPQLKGQVIWVDEAGMLSNRDMNAILTIAQAQQARIILSGDTAQHKSVLRGDALRIIEQETKLAPITVDKIQRQRNSIYKEAVQLLGYGKVQKGFSKLEQIGAIQEIADTNERIHTIADDYYSSTYRGGASQARDVLVVAPTHAEGDAVTSQIRQVLKEKHVLAGAEHTYTILKNRQYTQAQKQQSETYQCNDRVVFHQHGKGIRAGARLTVLHADDTFLYANDANGNTMSIPLSQANKFSVYQPELLQLAAGDKIRITSNGKDSEGKHLFNGTTFFVDHFDAQGNPCLSNGSVLPRDFGHFTHGYVSTSHGSQGKTADKVIISQSSHSFRASSMEQFYVSVSRGKQAVSIYTDNKEVLKEAVGQSEERLSATELMATRQRQSEEITRYTLFRRWQEKAADAYTHLLAKYQTNNGFQTTIRTEQEQSR